MKRMLAVAFVVTALALAVPKTARAGVDVSFLIGLPFPGVVVAPAPVVVPQPVYVPAPVLVPQPYYPSVVYQYRPHRFHKNCKPHHKRWDWD